MSTGHYPRPARWAVQRVIGEDLPVMYLASRWPERWTERLRDALRFVAKSTATDIVRELRGPGVKRSPFRAVEIGPVS